MLYPTSNLAGNPPIGAATFYYKFQGLNTMLLTPVLTHTDQHINTRPRGSQGYWTVHSCQRDTGPSLGGKYSLTGASSAPKHDKHDHESPIPHTQGKRIETVLFQNQLESPVSVSKNTSLANSATSTGSNCQVSFTTWRARGSELHTGLSISQFRHREHRSFSEKTRPHLFLGYVRILLA